MAVLPFFFAQQGRASGGMLFSGLSEKSMQKRDAGVRNSAYAPEKAFCFCMPFTDGAVREERPSGGRRIGFPKRTIGRANRFFAPVEYLTYEIRKMSV